MCQTYNREVTETLKARMAKNKTGIFAWKVVRWQPSIRAYGPSLWSAFYHHEWVPGQQPQVFHAREGGGYHVYLRERDAAIYACGAAWPMIRVFCRAEDLICAGCKSHIPTARFRTVRLSKAEYDRAVGEQE